MTPNSIKSYDFAGLIGALKHQRQIDEDGSEVGVSRQAVDEACEIVELWQSRATHAAPVALTDAFAEYCKTLPVSHRENIEMVTKAGSISYTTEAFNAGWIAASSRRSHEGWVWVPREPTEAMVAAGFTVHPCATGSTRVTDAYRAMIAAAHEAPSGDGGGK